MLTAHACNMTLQKKDEKNLGLNPHTNMSLSVRLQPPCGDISDIGGHNHKVCFMF